ncbi:prevent-host-death protein, partial [Mesorhizobium sp. M0437]
RTVGPWVVAAPAVYSHLMLGRRGGLGFFLGEPPQRGAELDLERQRDEPRDLPL